METMDFMMLDKCIDAAKKIHIVDACDEAVAEVIKKAGGNVAYKMRTEKEKAEDFLYIVDYVQGLFPEGVKAADEALSAVITYLTKGALGYLNGNHGSKVKADYLQGCRIVFAGDISYIEVPNADLGHAIIYLTPEYVESCSYIRKKYKLHLFKHHYYFSIYFKGGTHSYIRVSRKHLENMKKLGAVIPD